MIKALFFDLDGTLLNTKKEISPITRKTLEKCRENNIKLYIATARPPMLDRMLSWDADTLSLFDGGSYHNGGCVVMDGKKTYTPITDKIVGEILSCVCQYDAVNIALQLEDEKHAFRYPLEEKSYKGWGVSPGKALTLEQAGSLRTIKTLVFYADLIQTVTPIEKELVEKLMKICQKSANLYLTDQGKCIQIMAKAVNKLNSIEKMRTALGLEKNEIAVFGDDVNDLEMLSEYEYSVAMGNAENHIKNTASYITLDNDSDGIHHAICNILKLI